MIDLDALPEPGKNVAVRVRPDAERAVRDGHPWVFGDSLVSVSRKAAPGDVAVIFDRKDRFLAAGLYDPESPIRIRVLAHPDPQEIGSALFLKRLGEALGRRADVASRQTTGFRLVNGANDGLPGLVIDQYDRTLVLQLFTVAWLAHLRDLEQVLRELLAPERIILLPSGRVGGSERWPRGAGEGGMLFGPAPDGGVPFLETGLRLEAHPFVGQKTGFYLDQRANRRRLSERVQKGERVLNVFSYTGGFSLYAARAGAGEVVSVDQAAPALRQARRHFELNAGEEPIAAARHRTLAGDAFEVMARLADEGERYDVVLVDPPSFTRSAAHRDAALAGYRRLTRLSLPLLRPGGLLVQASCSSRVSANEFYHAVTTEAREAGRPLTELERTGHAPDHPVSFPEGRYLKCLWARVD